MVHSTDATLESSSPPADLRPMDAEHWRELVELEDSYWWHVAKRELVLKLLRRYCPPPARLLEGGFGSAGNLLAFQNAGYQVQGLDNLQEAVDHARTRDLEHLQVHDLSQPWPIEAESVDAVVMLDVLEHLPNPVEVMRFAGEALLPGGYLFATVPALPSLYSEWDRRLGHYCRYRLRDFKDQMTFAGFQCRKASYWNSFSLAPALYIRKVLRRFNEGQSSSFPAVSPWMNRALLTAACLERTWLLRLPVPIGLSIVGVFQK